MFETNEFSFVLAPSRHGVGVFAAHKIAKGTLLRLMGDGFEDYVERRKKDVPKRFRCYCLGKNRNTLICPKDFGHMSLEWFVNHASAHKATAETFDGVRHYAVRDIIKGEEITLDYLSFQEDPSWQDPYYFAK